MMITCCALLPWRSTGATPGWRISRPDGASERPDSAASSVGLDEDAQQMLSFGEFPLGIQAISLLSAAAWPGKPQRKPPTRMKMWEPATNSLPPPVRFRFGFTQRPGRVRSAEFLAVFNPPDVLRSTSCRIRVLAAPAVHSRLFHNSSLWGGGRPGATERGQPPKLPACSVKIKAHPTLQHRLN